VQVLNDAEKQAVHEATLEVLDTIGVRAYDPGLREIMRKRGARVDDATGDVRLAPALVMESLAQAPHAFDLLNRRGQTLPIPAKEAYICQRALLPKTLDYGATTPREPVMADIVKSCQIANALDDVHWILRTDTPVSDIAGPPEFNGLLSMQLVALYTDKHLFSLPISYQAALDWVAIAEAASESGDLSKERIMTMGLSSTAPLQLDRESCGVLRLSAEKGIPTFVMPMPAGGGTAPVTTAGEVVQLNAEAVFMAVAVQMVNPGCPVFYGGIPCTLDLRSGIISMSSPEYPAQMVALLEMGRFYGLPLCSPSKYTDSLTFDEQAGAEKIMSSFATLAAGSDVIYANGDLDNALVLSLEQHIIDLDIVLAARRFVQGIIVDKDRLAVEAIRRVGPAGHYLEDPHTMKYMRAGERLTPKSYNRLGHRSTAKTQLEKAHEIVAKLTAKPAQPVASPAAIARIEAAVARRKAEPRADQ
jgi:trimethylamine--corrinoid protein Co-methyltransferase